jgi:hypothetical protein
LIAEQLQSGQDFLFSIQRHTRQCRIKWRCLSNEYPDIKLHISSSTAIHGGQIPFSYSGEHRALASNSVRSH